MKKGTLIVDDTVALRALGRKPFRTELPELATLRQAILKMEGCCGGRAYERQRILDATKETLANLSEGQMTKLKELLNTDNLRFIYRDMGGKTQDRTF